MKNSAKKSQILRSVLNDVHDCFIYTKEKEDVWTSHADDVLMGKKFKDDCDGFALTCAELLLKRGLPRSDISLIICTLPDGEGHLVCGCNLDGTTWILDNNYKYVYDWSDNPCKWKYFMKLDDLGKWRSVKWDS